MYCNWYWQTQVTAAYGPANEMTSLSYYGYNETRTYNNLLQLTRQTVPGKFDTEYLFSAGQNNGQIYAAVDHISGQQVNYTYDSLKRLSTAGTAGAGWGQAYSYDGFGNLTAAMVTQGSGVNFAQAYDPATNHAVGNPQFVYDANGNETRPSAGYDEENRMSTPDGYNTYVYDPSGKRVWAGVTDSGTGTLYFYDIFGKQITSSGSNSSVYFGNRLVVSAGAGVVVTDRLGSVRVGASAQPLSYLPYGVEQTSTPNGQVKFGTYVRDGNSSTLGADYADQRYYNPWYGRFNTPDPAGTKAVALTNPITWNKYIYVNGDPVNSSDPTGLCGGDGLVDCVGYDGAVDLGLTFAQNASDAASGLNVFGDGLPAGPAILGLPIVTSSFDPVDDTPPAPSEDVAIDPRGQVVGSLVTAANTQGFINFTGAAMATAAAIPIGIATATEVAGVLSGTTSLTSAVAQPTTVIGQVIDTTPYIGQAGYNALSTVGYSAEVQAMWIAQVATSGQSVMLVTQAPAAASMTAAEAGFLQTVFGYTQIGSFLVPPIP